MNLQTTHQTIVLWLVTALASVAGAFEQTDSISLPSRPRPAVNSPG